MIGVDDLTYFQKSSKKGYRLIESCKTVEQLHNAKKYIQLQINRYEAMYTPRLQLLKANPSQDLVEDIVGSFRNKMKFQRVKIAEKKVTN